MNRSPTQSLVVAVAIGLVMSGFALSVTAQTLQEQQQRQEDRKEQKRETRTREVEIVQRRRADSEHREAKADHALWVERRLRKPVVGLLLAPDDFRGVRIAGITPDSAAEQAGLKSGDRLISISGSQILGSDGELRVANARKLLGNLDTKTPVRLGYLRDGKAGVAMVTPKLGERVAMLPGNAGESKRIRIVRGDGDHVYELDTDHPEDMLAPHAAAEIHKEIIRLGPGGECKGANCRTPMLMSAFRWNGLNLASLDPQLGRYFGTDKGVLVLSTGELKGLQSGDVIQSVEGKSVNSPRDVMDALRDKPANASVAVGYLRDRKPGKTNITVPSVLRRLPVPPAPPAPPAPPSPPKAPKAPLPPPPRAADMAVPPMPPMPPAPAVIEARHLSLVSEESAPALFEWGEENAGHTIIEEIEVEMR